MYMWLSQIINGSQVATFLFELDSSAGSPERARAFALIEESGGGSGTGRNFMSQIEPKSESNRRKISHGEKNNLNVSTRTR